MPTLPLLTLHDREATYKGYWNIEQSRPGNILAIHATFTESSRVGCVIEQRRFTGVSPALAFTNDLLRHGWRIHDLHEAGEYFKYQLAIQEWTRAIVQE